MDERPSILLTNDDGIDAAGLSALAAALDAVGDVTVVAPVADRSGAGRSRTIGAVSFEEREAGYAVRGTPADCVIVGVCGLERTFDVVVSGCNDGPNVGAHVLARSGTVGAAIEAGYLGVPAIAVSMYEPSAVVPDDPGPADFGLAADATRFLVERLLGGAFANADYLNVNAPAGAGVRPDGDATASTPAMRLTRPSETYDLDATVGDGEVELRDRFWQRLLDLTIADPAGTDCRACVEGEISVTPLSAPHATVVDPGDAIEGFESWRCG